MRSHWEEGSRTTKTFFAKLATGAALAMLVLMITLIDTRIAAAGLTVKPITVLMKTTVGTFIYKMVTISNTGSTSETITGADATAAPFWMTWGGTCNNLTYDKVIPAHGSCTLQWGFHPTATGLVTGLGNITFKGGATVSVFLNGIGK
jgi:hypothetical protein